MTEISMAMMSVEALAPNPWNTNQMTPEGEAKLEASIKRLDMFKPIVVRTLADGTLQIIGGQHRWEAAVRLGYEKVPVVNVGAISDKKAKEIGVVDNGRYGADDAQGLADLLKGLGDMADLNSFLPDDIAVHALMDDVPTLTDQDLKITDEADKTPAPPLSPPDTQAMRFNVPVEDVAWIQALLEDTIREQNFTTDDSKTNAGNAIVFLLNKTRK